MSISCSSAVAEPRDGTPPRRGETRIGPGRVDGGDEVVSPAEVRYAGQLRCSSTTVAQFRPLAPHTPAPGKVAAPVRYSPSTAVS